MSKDEHDFLEKLRETSVHAAAEIMEGLQRLRDFHAEIADDGSGAPRPVPRVGDHFYQLARLELEHAASVLRLGSVQAEMLFEHVRQLARRSRGEAPRPVLLLAAPATGAPCVGSFEIRNPFDCAVDVRFEVSRLRGDRGEEWPELPRVACRPAPIPPHGAARVEVTLGGAAPATVLFGELDVYLSGDVERRGARRAIKVRPHA